MHKRGVPFGLNLVCDSRVRESPYQACMSILPREVKTWRYLAVKLLGTVFRTKCTHHLLILKRFSNASLKLVAIAWTEVLRFKLGRLLAFLCEWCIRELLVIFFNCLALLSKECFQQ